MSTTDPAGTTGTKRLLFVISEREGGITPEWRNRYLEAEAQISSLTDAHVESRHYWAIEAPDADALVLSGSGEPWALHAPAALERFYDVLRSYDGPVLGICAGMQTLVRAAGGSIGPAGQSTHGFARVGIVDDSDLFAGCSPSIEVFQDHSYEVTDVPSGMRVLATSATCSVEAIAAGDRPWWGTQFHPEAWDREHPDGQAIIESFLRIADLTASDPR
ncbi:type 1 glutamine amidotransferase [Gaiella sp.]|uniref:type 1 glutamine amidotransferase n=1 Tax=Gaiella sp. TaxID=2663207 RepID=UPI003983A9E1